MRTPVTVLSRRRHISFVIPWKTACRLPRCDDRNHHHVRAPAVRLLFRVAGVPAGFANGAREQRWKEALRGALTPLPVEIGSRALRLRFVLPPPAPGRPGSDLDNLLDPVLAVLVGELRWFGGVRPSIEASEATKERGAEPGCELELLAAPPSSAAPQAPLLDALYEGPLPRSGTDQVFTEWVQRLVAPGLPPVGEPGLGAALIFHGPRVNLGDIATGRPKNVIDCFWPLIGGCGGAPDDHLVTELRLSRSEPSDEAGVHVLVWQR
jgi:hypothetical protein